MLQEIVQTMLPDTLSNKVEDPKRQSGLETPPPGTEVHLNPTGCAHCQTEQAVLREQITLLRDLLEGKNHWLAELLNQERERNKQLQAEVVSLRKTKERIARGLVEALIVDKHGAELDSENWEELWGLLD